MKYLPPSCFFLLTEGGSFRVLALFGIYNGSRGWVGPMLTYMTGSLGEHRKIHQEKGKRLDIEGEGIWSQIVNNEIRRPGVRKIETMLHASQGEESR